MTTLTMRKRGRVVLTGVFRRTSILGICPATGGVIGHGICVVRVG
jgi:hypothetical protein